MTDETMLAYVPDYRAGHADGIREGERRTLWAIAVGAEWWLAFDYSRDDYELVGCVDDARERALKTLRHLGDEDASRVLGERGW